MSQSIGALKKIVEIEGIDRHSFLIFITHIDEDEILAYASFAESLCVSTENGKPVLDEKLFGALTKKEQLKEIKSIVSTVATFMKSSFEMYYDLSKFGENLIELEAKISGKPLNQETKDYKTLPPQPVGQYFEQIKPNPIEAKQLLKSLKSVTKEGRGGFISDDAKIKANRETSFVIREINGIPRTLGESSKNAVRIEWSIDDSSRDNIFLFWAESWKGWRQLLQRVREQLRYIIRG